MRDKLLRALLMQTAREQGGPRGLSAYGTRLRYQPMQQGRPEAPTFYLFKVSDKRIGQRKVWYIPTDAGLELHEKQLMESVYQFFVTQPPGDPMDINGLTHSDALKILAGAMQSDDTITALQADDVQLLRVTDIRDPQFKNDFDQWEENPSFDLTVRHNDEWIQGQPIITRYELRIIALPDNPTLTPNTSVDFVFSNLTYSPPPLTAIDFVFGV